MDFFSGGRVFFANFNIFIAEMIAKIYNLILDLATLDLFESNFNSIVHNFYKIIGLFMLFKLALSVINYIINPDNFISEKVGVKNIILKIILSLGMLTLFPTVFSVMANIQKIVLNENIIPKIILGHESSRTAIDDAGKELSYLVFSSFIDYNRLGALSLVFPSDCPNIFFEEDYENTYKTVSKQYCSPTLGIRVPTCASFITPYNNIPYGQYAENCFLDYNDDSEIDYGRCMDYLNMDSRFDNADYVGYYSCKLGKAEGRNTLSCGIKNGLYVFQLINRGREEREVKYIFAKEVITATESDPLLGSRIYYCPYNAEDSDEREDVKDSDGDYIFEYKFFFSTVTGIIVFVMMVIIAVDVAIRTIKLAFLQMIAPVPIVSYMDVNESKLFSSWIRMLLSTYLELFIKLAIVFSILLITVNVINSKDESLRLLQDNSVARIIFVVGMLFFCFGLPKFISQLFNFKTDGGLMSMVKGAGKFLMGAGAMAVAGAGGSVANLASGISEQKGFGRTVASVIAGGNSAALRTLGGQIKNKGNVNLNTIRSGIRGSVNARSENDIGNHIGRRALNEFRNLFQIDPEERMDSKKINTEIEKVQTQLDSVNQSINTMNQRSSHILELNDAFKLDDSYKRIYADYDDYHIATSSTLTRDEYDKAAPFYEERNELQIRLNELNEQLEKEQENERFNQKYNGKNN